MKSIVYCTTGVDSYINTMKTTFLFNFRFLTNFFKLQVHKYTIKREKEDVNWQLFLVFMFLSKYAV